MGVGGKGKCERKEIGRGKEREEKRMGERRGEIVERKEIYEKKYNRTEEIVNKRGRKRESDRREGRTIEKKGEQ